MMNQPCTHLWGVCNAIIQTSHFQRIILDGLNRITPWHLAQTQIHAKTENTIQIDVIVIGTSDTQLPRPRSHKAQRYTQQQQKNNENVAHLSFVRKNTLHHPRDPTPFNGYGVV